MNFIIGFYSHNDTTCNCVQAILTTYYMCKNDFRHYEIHSTNNKLKYCIQQSVYSIYYSLLKNVEYNDLIASFNCLA